MDQNLKLFVWEGVLEDYTAGITFALARTATEAKQLLIKKGITEHRWKGIKLDGVEPSRYSSPTANYVYGGG